MRTPLRAGLVLLVVASPALAQQISLAFGGVGSVTSLPFNQASCNANNSYIVTWTASGLSSSNACGNMQIFVRDASSCPNGLPNTGGGADAGSGNSDVIIGTVDLATLATGSGTLPSKRLRDMPGLSGNCPDGVTTTNAVCATVQYRATGSTSCDSFQTSTTNLTLQYDAKPPVPPGINLLPQDAKIQVQLDAQGETLKSYQTQYAEAPPGNAAPVWRQGPSLEASKTSVAISGLTNGVQYLVQARSVDVVDNVSDYTTPLSATPQASNGFWGEYKDAGGHEQGGCSTADAAAPSVLGAVGILIALAWRRR